MKFLKQLCQGSLIGASGFMPGVSGGTLAVSMGLYDKILYSVNHFTREPKESLRTLLPVGIGAVLGLLGLSYGLRGLFDNFPVQTNLLFAGLILGGIPDIVRIAKKERAVLGNILLFLLFFGLIVGIPCIGAGTKDVILEPSVLMVLKMFGVGILAALTMVVPGVSGSAILLIIGYYQPILNEITDCISGFFQMDSQWIMRGILILGPMAIGMAAGVIWVAALMEYLLKHYRGKTYWAILGLVLASPVGIFTEIMKFSVDFFTILTGAAAMAAGIFLSRKIGEKES